MKFNTISADMEKELLSLEKPVGQLIGQDGNAFSIMAIFARASRTAGWLKPQTDCVLAEMRSDDYDHLLGTVMTFMEESYDE